MAKKNPWETIPLSDYEAHMQHDSVGQLQALNALMQEQLTSCRGRSVLILGVAGGNGLEHIVPGAFEHVYGVDVSEEYLAETKRRYPQLAGVLECLQADLTDEGTDLPHADIVIANLLVEYIGVEAFAKVVRAVCPVHVSCVIQVDPGYAWVSSSPYAHAFDVLESVHCAVDEHALTKAMRAMGFGCTLVARRDLASGKALVRVDYQRP